MGWSRSRTIVGGAAVADVGRERSVAISIQHHIGDIGWATATGASCLITVTLAVHEACCRRHQRPQPIRPATFPASAQETAMASSDQTDDGTIIRGVLYTSFCVDA
ncbi:MAG: hypothetical protein R2825_12635 [Saprospiraceae bacterium]